MIMTDNWVKTSSRLPEVIDSGYILCWIVVKNKVMPGNWYESTGIFTSEEGYFKVSEVSHWMIRPPPLPPCQNPT